MEADPLGKIPHIPIKHAEYKKYDINQDGKLSILEIEKMSDNDAVNLIKNNIKDTDKKQNPEDTYNVFNKLSVKKEAGIIYSMINDTYYYLNDTYKDLYLELYKNDPEKSFEVMSDIIARDIKKDSDYRTVLFLLNVLPNEVMNNIMNIMEKTNPKESCEIEKQSLYNVNLPGLTAKGKMLSMLYKANPKESMEALYELMYESSGKGVIPHYYVENILNQLPGDTRDKISAQLSLKRKEKVKEKHVNQVNYIENYAGLTQKYEHLIKSFYAMINSIQDIPIVMGKSDKDEKSLIKLEKIYAKYPFSDSAETKKCDKCGESFINDNFFEIQIPEIKSPNKYYRVSFSGNFHNRTKHQGNDEELNNIYAYIENLRSALKKPDDFLGEHPEEHLKRGIENLKDNIKNIEPAIKALENYLKNRAN